MQSRTFEIQDGTLIRCLTKEPQALIPDGVTVIGPDAFSDDNTVERIVFPASVREIDARSCCECPNLREIVFNEHSDLRTIGAFAFSGCSVLKDISFPQGLDLIDESAFFGCKGFKNIIIPQSVSEIGRSAFEECSEAEVITLPHSMKKLRTMAFCGCRSVEHIDFPQGPSKVENLTFFDCISLAVVNLPDTVTDICQKAFAYCFDLSYINFPQGLETIQKGAFCGCVSLERINIPKDLMILEPGAFEDCKRLTDVTLPDKYNNDLADQWSFRETIYYRKRHRLCARCGSRLRRFTVHCFHCGFDISPVSSVILLARVNFPPPESDPRVKQLDERAADERNEFDIS